MTYQLHPVHSKIIEFMGRFIPTGFGRSNKDYSVLTRSLCVSKGMNTSSFMNDEVTLQDSILSADSFPEEDPISTCEVVTAQITMASSSQDTNTSTNRKIDSPKHISFIRRMSLPDRHSSWSLANSQVLECASPSQGSTPNDFDRSYLHPSPFCVKLKKDVMRGEMSERMKDVVRRSTSMRRLEKAARNHRDGLMEEEGNIEH